MPRALPAPSLRARLRRAAPPRPLAVLLVIVAAVGMSWALAVPPWQSPDEVAHFAYAQSLGAGGRLPGDTNRLPVSSDQTLADGAVGASRGAFYPQTSPPDWSRADWNAYLRDEHSAQRPSASNGGGPNPASTNPPFYYGFADVAYLLDPGGTAFGRLYGMQFAGVVLLLISTVAAWLLAGEVFGRRRLAQLACAGVVGLLPMDTFISTSVNPDAMMITVWTLALWLGARLINHGGRAADAAALCAVTACAVLTKATSYALVVPVVLALAMAWWRRPSVERRPALRGLATAALALVLPIIGWLALAHALHRSAVNAVPNVTGAAFSIKEFLSYVWQFYLPKLGFMYPFSVSRTGLGVYTLWVNQATAGFGWLSVGVATWIYPVAAGIVGALLLGSAWCVGPVLRRRNSLALFAFFLVALITLLGLLHVTDYRSVIYGDGPILQGRYLLPVVGLFGLAVGIVITRLPARWRAPSAGVVVCGLLAFQLIALSAIVKGYYL